MRLLVAVVLAGTASLVAPPPGLADEPDAHYRINLPATVEAAPGESSSVSLTIAARPGYTISRQGPLVVTLAVASDAAVKLPRTAYRRADAADARAADPRFDLRFRALTPGRAVIGVEARVWVCTRYTCRPVREQLEVTIEVVAPPPAAEVDAGA